MEPRYIDLRKGELQLAAQAIKNGNLVLFPTETVYGIGANALDEIAVAKIFKAKGRNEDNPLIVHISNLSMLNELVKNINKTHQKLMDAFWPGPFTIVFDSTEKIAKNVRAGLDTVGVRMPSNKIAKELIEYSGVPIAAPSANISGRPSGTKIEDIINELDGKVECIIDDGPAHIGLESTVVRVIKDKVHILRPGKITPEGIRALGLDVCVGEDTLKECKGGCPQPSVSPGTKYKHYAPKTKCVLIYSDNEEKMIQEINKLLQSNADENLVICKTKNLNRYKTKNKIAYGNTLEEISKNIFTTLRKIDKYDIELAIIEGVEKKGLGLAIMDRLIRACENNYIEL